MNIMNTNSLKHGAGASSLMNQLTGQIQPIENDPIHAMMVKRKHSGVNPLEDKLPEVINYDANDYIELQEFCMKYNLICPPIGRMSPKATLEMIKKKMGIREEAKQNFVSKKQLLNG